MNVRLVILNVSTKKSLTTISKTHPKTWWGGMNWHPKNWKTPLEVWLEGGWAPYGCWPENTGTPRSSILIWFSMVFHYKASILGAQPYFWKHPTSVTFKWLKSPFWFTKPFCILKPFSRCEWAKLPTSTGDRRISETMNSVDWRSQFPQGIWFTQEVVKKPPFCRQHGRLNLFFFCKMISSRRPNTCLENKLLLISIDFTLKTSHSCLKKMVLS